MGSISEIFNIELMDFNERLNSVCFKCGIVGAKYRLVPKHDRLRTVCICNKCLLLDNSLPKTNKPLEEEKMDKNKEMTTYFVSEKTPAENVRSALGRMIEYVKFLEKETGRNGSLAFSDTILEEEDVEVTTECPKMMIKIDDADPENLVSIIKEIFTNANNSDKGLITSSYIATILDKHNIDLTSL